MNEEIMEKKNPRVVTRPGNDTDAADDGQISGMIFREISKAFEYILKFYDLHKR